MSQKSYSPPTIVAHQAGQMNAQAHGQSADVCAAIDGVPVADLVAEHGSPLYVFSEAALRQAYRAADRAFRTRYPDVQFAWSYKTNYLKAICAVFHQEGAIAEVVSDFEYEKARGMGVPGRDVIFNGPYKSAAALERAVAEGAKIQIDNFDELALLASIAEARGETVDVALRVYMDSGVPQVWSKFGFNADMSEAVWAMKRVRASPHLRLVGLHTHVGTFILDPKVYTRAAAKLVELAVTAHREYGFTITYLNMGGGLPSLNRLHYQYLPAETAVPPVDDFAEAITRPILDRWPKDWRLPRLYLESGRALVDEAGYLITTLVALKQRPAAGRPAAAALDGRDKTGYQSAGAGATGYLVDSGINLLYTASWYQFNIRPARACTGPLTERTLYGCLCMNIDVIHQNVALPNMNVGDQLVIHPVGAYNITQSMQFITYRPRVVMVTEGGAVEVIREREDLRHIEALERLPKSLAPVARYAEPASRE